MTSSVVGFKICVIIAVIKKDKSIIKKKRKQHKIVFLAKTKFNKIEVLVSKFLADSYIGHVEFILINNVLKGYEDLKKNQKY